MKIGDWQATIQEEEKFWRNWADALVAEDKPTQDRPPQWQVKANVVMRCLECLEYVLTPEAKILEIGPGIIGIVNCLPAGQLYVCEPLWSLFQELRPKLGKPWETLRHDVTLLAEKAEDLPLDSGPFDLVIMINTLDHCEDPCTVLYTVSQTTKSSGLLFEATTVWANGDLGTKVDAKIMSTGHPHLYLGTELVSLIKQYGFELVDDPLCGEDITRYWHDYLGFTEQSWPCYLRAWKKT